MQQLNMKDKIKHFLGKVKAWLADKREHIIAGVLIALFIALPCYYESKYNLTVGLYSAIYVGVVSAAVKEFTDYCHIKRWDWKDFAATCIGAVIVALIILGLHFGKG
jgi:hypothetical protein